LRRPQVKDTREQKPYAPKLTLGQTGVYTTAPVASATMTQAQTTSEWNKLATSAPKRPHIIDLVLVVIAIAWLALVAFMVLGPPREILGYRTAFDALRVLGYVGAGGAIISVSALVLRRGFAVSRMSAALATLLFAVPVSFMLANQATPPPGEPINDITTDLDDPPEFSAVIPLRPPGSNPIEYGGPSVAARQRAAYPDIGPISSALEPEAAFQKAFETAEDLGWEIVSGDMQAGVIEAVDTTRFFRFKDDVVIRIRANQGGSRIDLRSRSRIGRSDLGKNAKRIRSFIEEFEK